MNAEELSALITILLISITLNVIGFGFRTWDTRITEGKKFKINDSVYQCRLIQELEYDK